MLLQEPVDISGRSYVEKVAEGGEDQGGVAKPKAKAKAKGAAKPGAKGQGSQASGKRKRADTSAASSSSSSALTSDEDEEGQEDDDAPAVMPPPSPAVRPSQPVTGLNELQSIVTGDVV